jgi:N-acetylmuramic acid 6-phosphate etherase
MCQHHVLAVSIVADKIPLLEKVVSAIIDTLKSRGRLFYLGAGTSGRLGVLDAIELGPTFGAYDDQVVALLAGGREAMWQAIEGSEDDGEAAIRDLKEKKLSKHDFLIGISASATTPYTLAGLKFAKRLHAKTCLISVNEKIDESLYTFVIKLPVGEEIVKGSTRLTAGSAQKMVLNMLSTAAMMGLGKTLGPYMTHVSSHNDKLKSRQIEILQEVLEVDSKKAKEILKGAKGDVAAAIISTKYQMPLNLAQDYLRELGGDLNAVLRLFRNRKKKK